ncbi:uncharacterized protein LOC144798003 [Lissotriton helveticus]
MSPMSSTRLLVCLVLAVALMPPGAPASPECEQILEKPGEFYILGIFGICDEEGVNLAAYVFAQAFRFIFTQGSQGLTMGYKLMTYCEQPTGCPQKILKEIIRNHQEGHQKVVAVFRYGSSWVASLDALNVLQVSVLNDRISFKGTFYMEDYHDAPESLLALMKHFQWNLAGLIHYYDSAFEDLISEFDQRDNMDVCLEFQEKRSNKGKHLAERISSSQSNVTVAIDQAYNAIYYMQTAIESGEAPQITGKQIIYCCGNTIFQMEDFVPSAFQGVLSLFKRPRQLSGFQGYLLGFGTRGLENTTSNYFYNSMCHSCTSNPNSFKPCRNFKTYMTTNTKAGPFNIKELMNCTSGSIDICSECLSSLASLDTLFLMNSLINTIAMETEDLLKSQQSTLAQNGSSFDGVEYSKYLRKRLSQLQLINQNPFDVYYWNITADGEMDLLKMDIDLGTGISKSYDPVHRSIQLSNGRVVTMLPSHCLQSCQLGEKKKLSHNLPQVCCYKCEICEPGTYSNGSAFEECWSCPMDEWSQKGEQSCWKKSVVYMFWSEPINIFFVILSISGILLTILIMDKGLYELKFGSLFGFRIVAIIALQNLPGTAGESVECGGILEQEGDVYVLGVFEICLRNNPYFSLQDAVMAQLIRFAYQNDSGPLRIGYFILTFCERPSDCFFEAAIKIWRDHQENMRQIITLIASFDLKYHEVVDTLRQYIPTEMANCDFYWVEIAISTQ